MKEKNTIKKDVVLTKTLRKADMMQATEPRLKGLVIKNVPCHRDALESLTDFQVITLLDKAAQWMLQRAKGSLAKSALDEGRDDEGVVTLDFVDLCPAKPTAKASKAAVLDDLVQAIARAALAGDMEEVGRLQQRHLDMKKG